MSATLPAILLVLFFSVCANAQDRALAVYTKDAPDSIALSATESELQRILKTAGITSTLRQVSESESQEEFELLVVASFEGSCSPSKSSPRTAARSLGEAQVSLNGRVLPFFAVDCNLVLQTLQPLLHHLPVPLRSMIFGRAVARVMAHEIYHILAQAKDHDDAGVAKASFSLEDLTTEDFAFQPRSLRRMRATAAPLPVVQSSRVILPRE